MNDDECKKIAEALRSEAEDGRIPCAKALALARRLGVEPGEMGEVCNREHIKIIRCQLGCFR